MAKFFVSLYCLVWLLSGCVSASSKAQANVGVIPCNQDHTRQKLRSQELQVMVGEDQKDRTSPVDWSKVQQRDEARRKRVGEIFGEGCLKSADDYSAAALIFQHGNIPEHYFQAFLWSQKAFELGNVWEERSVANGVDRYLVSIGHKQLFGTQFSQDGKTKLWCIEPLENTFPDSRRVQYLKMSLQESIRFFLTFYQSPQTASEVKTCHRNFKNSPAGTVPGFW